MTGIIGRGRRQPSDEDLAIWQRAKEDLLDRLYTGLPGRLQMSGHRVIARWTRAYADRVVLEIGCGHGHHLHHAELKYRQYIGLDADNTFLRTLRGRFPETRVVNGDAYALPLRDHAVDCVLSVYCFEHLRQLSSCLAEVKRVLKRDGELLIGLPAEGGTAYGIGRKLTSKRYMERKYGIDYEAIVQWEHWNSYRQVEELVARQFRIVETCFLPFRWLPSVHLNAIVCLRCRGI